MVNSSVQQLHQAAQAQLRAGKRPEAILILEQLLRDFPNYAPAALMLGVIAQEARDLQAALKWFNRANTIDPALPEPYFLIGFILYQQRQLAGAIDAYRKFLIRRPGDGKALNNLGRALIDHGEVTQAVQTLRQAIAAAPKNAGAHSNLADALRLSGDLDAAIAQSRKAIEVDPNCAEAHSNLGIALVTKNRVVEGVASMQRALVINPRMFNPRFNIARALQDVGKLDEAVDECRGAIECRPTSFEAHNVLGNLLGVMGEVPWCIEMQKKAVALQPDHAANHGNLLLTLQYRDDISTAERLTAHRQWNAQHITRITPLAPIDRTANQRLRVGYVSPNFQAHSVAYFFEPVLAAHDRSLIEVFCYSDTKQTDEVTARLRASAEHWRDIVGQSDSTVARKIQQDRIDVLIDLAGHTAHNRLPVFGYTPAPVQITWLGYPDTTGMTAIDFRLTDAVADPPGESDFLHTEKLIRIEGGCWAYGAPASAPEPSPPPSLANGYLTFGSFSNLPKVTPQALQTWATILQRTPNSKLLIKAAGLGGKIGRDYVSRHLEQFGIEPNRYELVGWSPTTASHLQLYDRLDIALDTFPYNGTTTTCEALWMGVPLITFAGNRHAARVGASLLTHSNCPEWIATDIEDYIALAVRLAADPKQLAEIRRGLRTRLKASPLCDATRMARQLELIYRQSSPATAS